ncbi:hypothetical protein LINPERHAP1_LOCUS148, partial [Linum perenne]
EEEERIKGERSRFRVQNYTGHDNHPQLVAVDKECHKVYKKMPYLEIKTTSSHKKVFIKGQWSLEEDTVGL